MKNFSRREFIYKAGVGTSALSLSGALGSFNATAAGAGDYKALVCLFFLGGLDNHDTVIPYDQSSYNTWYNGRSALASRYNGTRDRAQLLALDGNEGGRSFALPPQMSALHDLYQQGNAAIVGNVGPLIAPGTAQQMRNGSVPTPARIASHNDQQSVWMSSEPEGAPAGWGGRFLDIQTAAGANQDASFSAIGVDGSNVLISGKTTRPLFVSSAGAPTLRGTSGQSYGSSDVSSKMRQHYEDAGLTRRNLFLRDLVSKSENAFGVNEEVARLFNARGAEGITMPNTGLGKKLKAVLTLMAARDLVGAKRQVFYIELGGFDTHNSQATTLPRLQSEISDAMGSFYSGTQQLGIANQVTTFTGSDFGRTLTSNGDGTDHGWGGHHFVMGGAVAGGRIHGTVGPTGTGHAHDFGQGRVVPTMAVDQYGASLGRWFGMSEGDLDDIFPNLGNFDRNAINLFS